MADKLEFHPNDSFDVARAKLNHNRWVDEQNSQKPEKPKKGCGLCLFGSFIVFATIMTVALPHVKL